MDALGNAITMMMPVSVEALLCALVAMVVLRFELLRRAGGWGVSLSSREAGRYAENFKRIVKQCAPEAAGLVACLTLAAALRARGDKAGGDETETWAEIKAQWPMLLTADTLLSLQAMLRLVVLLSIVLRAGTGGPAPLSEEATALWLCAGVARVALLTRTTVYMLDGPLGGTLPAACEVAVLPVLFALSRGVLHKAPASAILTVAGTALFAYRNHLNMTGDHLADSLFIFAHCFDALAAATYLLRTALIEGGAGARSGTPVGFTHLLMPVQAALSAYYFLQAFDAVPELVGAGRPFEVLQIANTAILGAYLGAAALYIAECFDGRETEGTIGDAPFTSRSQASS